MQQEKQNKYIRSAIDKLQQVPDGFQFNSQGIWAGLEQQLPGTKKKSMSWYYAAAAVLLATATLYFAFMSKDIKQVLHEQTATLPVSTGKISATPVIPQDNNQPKQVTASSIQSPKKKINPQIISSTPLVQKENNIIEIKEPQPIMTHVEQTAVIIPPVTGIQKEEPKKLPVTVLSKPVPKRYRVIHINELNYSTLAPDPQNNLGRYEFKKILQQPQEEKETILPTDNHVKQLFFFKIKPTTTTTTTIVEN